MRSQQGFTLIELMIVVAIIAILAAIAISQYQDYVIRSQVAEGSSLAAGGKTAVAEFYTNYGHFPAADCLASGNQSVGLAMPASIVGSYVSELRVSGECAPPLGAGTIVARFSSGPNQKANAAINTAGLLFSPITHAGSVAWKCKRFLLGGSVVLRDKWLPSSCR